MANGQIITTKGKNTMLYRTYTENGSLSSTLYLPATQFKVGVNNTTPLIGDTDLDLIVPIANGTICDDGDNQFTGSAGGANSTDNTTTYKEGGAVSDATAQNLITTGSNTSKVWTIADLAANGSNCDATKYIGLWLYIKDATALAKFASAGTALEIRIGADSTTNYYSKVYTAAELAVGWNWLSDGALLSTWTVAGTPGTLNDFQIRITTNNAADAFVAGDVVYDLLRQWTAANTLQDFVTGYLTLDYTNNEATIRCYLSTLQASGFEINGIGTFNEDTTKLMLGEDTFTAESKSDLDEFAFIIVERIL